LRLHFETPGGWSQAVLRAFALRLIDWLDVPRLENNHAPDSAAALASHIRARRGKQNR
jgi:hypothetical protein